ncbi:DUF4890 domain-containing protein [Spirosoma validum]|uniref:DUF4890 domain-containing protein n=1 Tax=Spirosoma validum TaxID=2771355 RepID=A0A927GGF8_9BACT|nr:DUF4890 domain-containing protein [Spirosoma validum]MBD2756952.1 DUF4890 domain-containing protein [Spirosoma validum]
MFKKIALSALMLSLFSFPLLAQQNTTPDAQSQSTTRMGRNRSMQQRPMADPETRARKMTDRMTQQLGLDQTASQKVYDATLTHAQKVDAIRANSDDKGAKAQALKANADDYKAKMKSILTPDQFTKLESMRDKMRHGRGRPNDMKEESDRK